MGHPTLGPGRASAGIVKRVAGDLRPPHRKEGFHAVLRCRGGDQQGLSDAVALLSCFENDGDGSGGGGDGGGGNGGRGPHGIGRASSAPEARGGGGGSGGGVGNDRVGGFKGGAQTAWDQPSSNAWAGAGVVGANYAPESFPGVDHHLTSGVQTGVSASPAEQWFPPDTAYGFPADAAYGSAAAAAPAATYTPTGFSMPRGEEAWAKPVSAWGGGQQQQQQQQQQYGVFDGPAARMRDAVSNAGHDASSYPSLPGGGNASRARTPRRFNGSIGKPSPPPRPPPPRGYGSSSLSSIAKLTPQGRAAASSSSAERQQPVSTTQTQTRLLTPAEISANFSDLQAPPRVIAPEEVVAPESTFKFGPGRKNAAKRDQNGSSAASPPLAPSSQDDWTSLSALSARDGGGALRSREAAAAAELACVGGGHAFANVGGGFSGIGGGIGGGGSGGGGGGIRSVSGGSCSVGSTTATTEDGEDEELGLSEGETFFVLEDMFGGLLLPEVLERVFRESGNNLEKV